MIRIGSFALGTAIIAANGFLLLTRKEPDITYADPVPTSSSQAESEQLVPVPAPQTDAETQSVRTLTAVKLPSGGDYKKAAIDDYRMLLKIDKKKTAAEKEAERKFDAVYSLDTTQIYDPQPEPLNFTATRSVADEYYTVNDIISGNTVTMNAHELLCQAVYSEIGSEWDEDAIKAQTVAAYSYLRFNDSINRIPTVGLKQNYPQKIENCVSAVEGQAVYYDGSIINAVYSASTAGYSVESERIWDVYYPYLRAVVSEYDSEDPNYGLEYVFTAEEVKSKLEEVCGITMSDDMKNWFVMDDIYSGRYVGYITVDGQSRITARTMQETFGLKSQAFTVSIEDGRVTFHTFGWGHGVGMSQWGACFYAKYGYTYDQILRHYYLNTTLKLSDENKKAVERGKQPVYTQPTVPDTPDSSVPDNNSAVDPQEQTPQPPAQTEPQVQTPPQTEPTDTSSDGGSETDNGGSYDGGTEINF